jgi:hypothetical protein
VSRKALVGACIVVTSIAAVLAGMLLAVPATRVVRPSAIGVDPAFGLWAGTLAIGSSPFTYWPFLWWIADRFKKTPSIVVVCLLVAPLVAVIPTIGLIAIFTQAFAYHAPASQWLEAYGFFVGFSLICLPNWGPRCAIGRKTTSTADGMRQAPARPGPRG